MKDVVIVSAARTPIGSFGGSLASLSAIQLAGIVYKAALSRAGVEVGLVEELFVGNVISSGLGQAPATQVAAAAGAYTIASRDCTTLENYSAKLNAEINQNTRANFTFFRETGLRFIQPAGGGYVVEHWDELVHAGGHQRRLHGRLGRDQHEPAAAALLPTRRQDQQADADGREERHAGEVGAVSIVEFEQVPFDAEVPEHRSGGAEGQGA